MTGPAGEEILTLEPLIDAIRSGVEGGGWELSGLQKTTSHQFEGRWEGEATRSAYLFFHPIDDREDVSIDVYLDETSRGLAGNLALVVDLLPLGALGGADQLLAAMAAVSSDQIEERYRRPVTLRFRIADSVNDVAGAETELRLKVRIPSSVIADGADSVVAMVGRTVGAFERILRSGALDPYASER